MGRETKVCIYEKLPDMAKFGLGSLVGMVLSEVFMKMGIYVIVNCQEMPRFRAWQLGF